MSSGGTKTGNLEMESIEMESIEKSQEDLIREQQYAIESLENEIDNLRRRMNSVSSDDSEDRLYEMTRELMQAHRRNRKLTGTLREAKERLEELKEKVEQLSAPPNNYGIFLQKNSDGTVKFSDPTSPLSDQRFYRVKLVE